MLFISPRHLTFKCFAFCFLAAALHAASKQEGKTAEVKTEMTKESSADATSNAEQEKKSAGHDKANKNKDQHHEKISITAYRNGYALAIKKIKQDLKAGKQNIIFDGSPKTVLVPSLMPSFDTTTDEAEVLSQTIAEEGDKITFEVFSAFDQVKHLSLRFMFSGLHWDIYYIGTISKDHKQLDLSGWIEAENNTGANIHQAQILFQGNYAKMHGLHPAEDIEESDFSYMMPRLVDLPHAKKLFLNFFNKRQIPLKQDNIVYVGGEYLFDMKGEVRQPEVKQVVEFKNDETAGFKFPLPQGKITLYQSHESDQDALIGTYVLQEKALGQSVPLQLSSNMRQSPIMCELEQTDYKKISATSSEAGYKLTLTNREATSSVRIIVNLPESDWTVIRTSLPYDTNSRRQFSWIVQVPADQTVEIKYRLKLDNIR